jgi:hypothetical protein
LFDRRAERLHRRPGCDVIDDVEDRVGGASTLSEDAEQRHDHDERGEDRQHGVVGERGGQVGALVSPELPQRLA